jgi:hypothetical protein
MNSVSARDHYQKASSQSEETALSKNSVIVRRSSFRLVYGQLRRRCFRRASSHSTPRPQLPRLRLYFFLPHHNPIFLFPPKPLTYLYNTVSFLSSRLLVLPSASTRHQQQSVANCLDSQTLVSEPQAVRLETQSSTINTPQHRRVLSNLYTNRVKAHLLHSVCVWTQLRRKK